MGELRPRGLPPRVHPPGLGERSGDVAVGTWLGLDVGVQGAEEGAHVGVCTMLMVHFLWGCVGSHERAKSTSSPASSSP